MSANLALLLNEENIEMTKARTQQVSLEETPFYHCYSRCVRRAFLCGFDRDSGEDYSHRKQWIVSRLQQLTSVFCIDVCAYAVMDNHYHLVLRVNVDEANALSVNEVLQRWMTVFSGNVLVQRYLSDEALSKAETLAVLELADTLRERLMDISWLMRCLNEYIARLANKEDGCQGRFWDGRFKSQALLDDVALLTCMAYVDLNPVRAGLARTPEHSAFTSIQERIRGYVQEIQSSHSKSYVTHALNTGQSETSITSFQPKPLLDFVGGAQQDQSIGIPFALDDYLHLVDWTGRAILETKRGSIPEDVPPILERLNINDQHWLSTVQHFQTCFPRMAGRLDRLKAVCERFGLSWSHGVGVSRVLFQ